MAEPPRPLPRPTYAERAGAALAFVGVGRVVTVAVSVLLVAAGSWWLLHSPAPPVERSLPVAGADPATDDSSALAPPTALAPPATIVVQAAGAVRAPGVYRLPDGARVEALIAAAGGATEGADPDALPLAAVLADGQRVYVPMLGEIPPEAQAAAAGAPPGPVDLNRATAEQLDELPGVGPATAAAIVEHRERNGPFASVEALLDVTGIGPAKLDGLRDLVTV